jgi:hypothetical protein
MSSTDTDHGRPALPAGRPARRAGDRRCPDRRGLSLRIPSLVPGSGAPATTGPSPNWGADFATRAAARGGACASAASSSARAPPPGCGMKASRRNRSKAGYEAWREAGGHCSSPAPGCRERGKRRRGCVWVTRARPKVDRIACPWLIRRFVDPAGGVPVRDAAAEVEAVADRFQRRALRYRRRVLEPSRASALQLRHRCWRSSGLASPALDRLATDRARGRHGDGWRLVPAGGGVARGSRSGCRACSGTIWSSSRPACWSTTPSTAGAAMRPARRPITGRQGRATDRGGRGDDDVADNGGVTGAASASACRRLARRRASGLKIGLLSLRRAGGADRADAQGAGRGAALDRRGALPARAELLHAAARTRGAAARGLYRLADAPDARRADRRAAVHPARCAGDAGPEHPLRYSGAMCR